LAAEEAGRILVPADVDLEEPPAGRVIGELLGDQALPGSGEFFLGENLGLGRHYHSIRRICGTGRDFGNRCGPRGDALVHHSRLYRRSTPGTSLEVTGLL